jgi:hypothetical protein
LNFFFIFFSFSFFSFPSFSFSSLFSFCFLFLMHNEQHCTYQQQGLSPLSYIPHGAPPASPPLPLPLPLRRAPHGWPWLPSHGEPHTSSFFFVRCQKRVHTTSLLQSPPSILSETNYNLQILRDFIFQLNSDFISNWNLNHSELLLHPYISLGAPPPCIPMPISPQNRTLASTQVPPLSPLLVVTATSIRKSSIQINPLASREKLRT